MISTHPEFNMQPPYMESELNNCSWLAAGQFPCWVVLSACENRNTQLPLNKWPKLTGRDNNVLFVKCLPLTGPHQFMFPDWFSTFRTAEVLDAEFCDWTVTTNRIMNEFNRMNYRKLSANKVFIRHSYWHIQHNVMKHKQWQIKQGVLLWTHEVTKCPEDRRQFDQRVLMKS